jgi:hypothetical protein
MSAGEGTSGRDRTIASQLVVIVHVRSTVICPCSQHLPVVAIEITSCQATKKSPAADVNARNTEMSWLDTLHPLTLQQRLTRSLHPVQESLVLTKKTGLKLIQELLCLHNKLCSWNPVHETANFATYKLRSGAELSTVYITVCCKRFVGQIIYYFN